MPSKLILKYCSSRGVPSLTAARYIGKYISAAAFTATSKSSM